MPTWAHHGRSFVPGALWQAIGMECGGWRDQELTRRRTRLRHRTWQDPRLSRELPNLSGPREKARFSLISPWWGNPGVPPRRSHGLALTTRLTAEQPRHAHAGLWSGLIHAPADPQRYQMTRYDITKTGYKTNGDLRGDTMVWCYQGAAWKYDSEWCSSEIHEASGAGEDGGFVCCLDIDTQVEFSFNGLLSKGTDLKGQFT